MMKRFYNINMHNRTLTWKSTHCPIAPTGIFELPIQIDFEQATLTYQFHTKEYDILFSSN